MPFTCRYCGQPYCSSHRLPENHDCRGLEDYKEQLRDRGQLIAETPEVKVQREIHDEDPSGGVRRRSRGAGHLEGLLQQLQGRVTWALLAVMGAVTVAFWAAVGIDPGLAVHFTLGPGSLLYPWAYLASVFSHADLMHILFNGFVLFFFGPSLERRVGSRTFLWFFVVTGVVAGVAQVALGFGLVEAGIQPRVPMVLGASGAILGVLGALTILAPDARVLLYFMIPMPLWLLTVGFAAINVVGFAFGLFGQSFGIAFLAHLTGLAIGLLVAHRYWRRTPGRQFETYTV